MVSNSYIWNLLKCRISAERREPGLVIDFNDTLRKVLGCEKVELVFDRNKNPFIQGVKKMQLVHLYDLMIYSDIVQSSITGDIESPLLRVVSVEPGHWSKQCLPLSKSNFQNISNIIRTDFGEKVLFESGRTILTLDFRRVSAY